MDSGTEITSTDYSSIFFYYDIGDIDTYLDFNDSDYFDYFNDLPYVINEDTVLADATNIVIIVVAILGLLANFLSIVSTLHIPLKQTVHFKLIISLCVSDFCIATQVAVNGFVTSFSEDLIMSYCYWLIETALINFALFATLFNLLVMALDHYLAIQKPLHYSSIMSHFRTNIIILVLWIVSIIGGLIDIIVAAFTDPLDQLLDEEVFCYDVAEDKFHAQTAPAFLVILELLILAFLYLKVFLEYRKFTARRRVFQQNDVHSKKAIITTGLIIGTFMICWIPISLYWIIDYYIVDVVNDLRIVIGPVSYILMVVNTLLDPLIYALRLPAVRLGYKNAFRKIFTRLHASSTNNVELEL